MTIVIRNSHAQLKETRFEPRSKRPIFLSVKPRTCRSFKIIELIMLAFFYFFKSNQLYYFHYLCLYKIIKKTTFD